MTIKTKVSRFDKAKKFGIARVRKLVVAQHATPHASTMYDTCPNGPSRVNLRRKMLVTPSGYRDIFVSHFRAGLASSRSQRSGCSVPPGMFWLPLVGPVGGGRLFPFVPSAGMEYSPALLTITSVLTVLLLYGPT